MMESRFSTAARVSILATTSGPRGDGSTPRRRMSCAERTKLIGYLKAKLEDFRVARKKRVVVPPRRMNNREFENSVRDVLGDKAPAETAERVEVMKALAGGRSSASDPSGWRGWFNRWFGAGGSQAGFPQLASGPATAGGGIPLAPPPPSGPGFFARLFRGLVQRSALSRIIGRKQAEYLERTLALFEEGNIDEALRHAIPFSSLPGAPTPPS